MRTRTPRSLSVLASRGRRNVASDRFISLASDCISLSVNPRPSENTAKELPSSGREEKTSHCVIASRRDGWLINVLQSSYVGLPLQDHGCQRKPERCRKSLQRAVARLTRRVPASILGV